MNGLKAYFGMMLRLQFRYRLAVFYSFLFPLIFLAAFRGLYRWETVPLVLHFGELLAIAILGGTCFGLPVTMVAERERGVWRRYRLLPTPIWVLVGGTIGVRFVLLVGAGLLQLLLAMAVGMPTPGRPIELVVAFTVVAFTFCGFGLIVAMLTSSVQAAQALGQCIFLPMLVLGGMARSFELLPNWTQKLAAFAPGKYAVDLIQACGFRGGLATVRYEIAVLLVMGVAACVTAAKMFRWDVRTGHERGSRLGWLGVTFAACLAIGFMTLDRNARAAAGRPADPNTPAKTGLLPPPPATNAPVAALVASVATATSWQALAKEDFARIDYDVPPDDGIVAPIALADNLPDTETKAWVDDIRGKLTGWPPGRVADPVQRVRNLLYVLAVPDVAQVAPLEEHLPAAVLDHLRKEIPKADLERILGWIALHPGEGTLTAMDQVLALGIEVRTDRFDEVRNRTRFYATKFLLRLQGA